MVSGLINLIRLIKFYSLHYSIEKRVWSDRLAHNFNLGPLKEGHVGGGRSRGTENTAIIILSRTPLHMFNVVRATDVAVG